MSEKDRMTLQAIEDQIAEKLELGEKLTEEEDAAWVAAMEAEMEGDRQRVRDAKILSQLHDMEVEDRIGGTGVEE